MSSIALAYDVPESWAVAVDVRPVHERGRCEQSPAEVWSSVAGLQRVRMLAPELPLGSTREKVPNSSAIAARLV